MSENLQDALARLAGPHAQVAIETIAAPDGLTCTEAAAVARAIPKRKAEFAAGRRAARTALAALGLSDASVPAGEDRAPIWPAGFIGSISHDKDMALAVVAREADCRCIGIDLAEAEPFPEHLRNKVLTEEENASLDGMAARVAFSAKEALYKALYPTVRQFFGFNAACIEPRIETGKFDAVLNESIGPYAAGSRFGGGLAIVAGRLITVLVVKT